MVVFRTRVYLVNYLFNCFFYSSFLLEMFYLLFKTEVIFKFNKLFLSFFGYLNDSIVFGLSFEKYLISKNSNQ